MPYTTYVNASNTATNGTALSTGGGNAERDIVVAKLIIGAPVSGGNIWLYNISNPVNAATTNIALKITLPTFSSTNINPGVYVLDFGDDGLLLNEGGNIIIDQTMQVSVLWHLLAEQNSQ